MSSIPRLFLLVVISVGLTGGIASAAPANDNFNNAIPLTGPVVTVAASNVGATKQFPGEPFVAGNFGGASVWWTWTATASGPTTIDTQGSDFNTLLGVFTGTAVNQLASVAQNNDFNGNTWSQVQFNAVGGTVYQVVVDGFAAGRFPPVPATGNIVLHIKGVGGVEITTPTNGMAFTLGDPIPVSVNLTPDFPNPPAGRADFYLNGNLFGTSTTPPFTAQATNAPLGSNSLQAVVFDNTGVPIQSPVVKVLVQNIGVTLLQPLDGTTFLSSAPITVTAHAFLPAGTINSIEFFVDGSKFGESASAPFQATWSNVTGGSHRFTAVGHSDAGRAYNSQSINIGVAQTLISSNSVWKYFDRGVDAPADWTTLGFDDSSWGSGPAPLGYGDSNGRLVLTTNSFGADPNNKFVTTYFRQIFQASHAATLAGVQLNLQRDDAAILYLNGQEIGRFNMPTGAVSYATFATANAADDGGTTFTASVPPSLLREGDNILASEIHQDAPNSSDIWFVMELFGVPKIIYNLSPTVVLTSPTNQLNFIAPSELALEASASDADGTVSKVEFYADAVKVGEARTAPYQFSWVSPPIGAHVMTAVATDDQGGQTTSDPVRLVVYDAVGTPVTRIVEPLDGAVMEGPTNLLFTAIADALDGVTNVQFVANGEVFANATTPPYTALWTSIFLSNSFVTIVSDVHDVRGTSAVVNVFITIPPTNTVAPTVAAAVPAKGLSVSNLTSVKITFSERVQNVDAADLLVSGIPATGVTGTGSNYVFTFPQPPYGEVEIAWANGHGITDFGFPSNLPFNELSPDAQWEYFLLDKIPPAVIARTPAQGAIVTNVSEINVTFSKPVTGVDAVDLLVNGVPATAVNGGGASYIFNVNRPPPGPVNVTWSTNNGIFDQAETPNAFVGATAAWSFTLDNRVTLLQSNANWLFVKGLSEPSTPSTAWRAPDFDDSGWSNAPAPFFYGDPYTNATIHGTLLSDMQSNYTTIYLRKEFVVDSLGAITNLLINHQSDDGFIAWLNGVEVFRYNVPGGDLPYTSTATIAVNEPSQTGAAYIVAVLTNNAVSYLVAGTNTLAIQALNQSLTTSTDFGFNLQLYYFPADASALPPRLVHADPQTGDVFALTNVTITFSEAVGGVDAADLLINGVAATDMTTVTNTTYTFSFPQPPFGPVLMTWAADHGIADFDVTPRAFDGSGPGATLSYTILNPSTPTITARVPDAGLTVTGLTAIVVTFSEPVTGVDASDLLVSGVPAASVSTTDNTTYAFSFAQPPFGAVSIRWAAGHGITDLDVPPAPFYETRFGAQWNYNLIDPVPSVTLTSPANNSFQLPPATVTLRATATDNDGTVALVEFYEQDTKLGDGTIAPFSLTVSDIPLGTYVYRAVATDNTGLRGTSAPVVLNVVTSLPISLVRGPYLQIGSPTGGVVRWRTDLISDAAVYYGPDPDHLTNTAVQAAVTNEHIVTITGLDPDTQYYYSIGSSGYRLVGGTNDGANYWFKTSPPVGTRRPIRIWALGDSGTATLSAAGAANQGNVRDAFYNYAVTNGQPDLWLMLGDNAYNSGLDNEYQTALFNMYPTTLRNRFLWPTIGNHESNQSFTSEDFPYLNIFSLPHQGEAGGLPSGSQKYYSFDYANIHFICLDSMTSGRATNTAMAQWLVHDLESTLQEWLIVFFHHPPYTRGNHNSDNETELIELRSNILPILEAHGVDLVMCGHSHAWERSYFLHGHYGLSGTLTDAMKVDGGDGRVDGTGPYHKSPGGVGTSYLVAGNGGQVTGGQLNHPANFISLNELGSVVLDVSSNRLDLMMLATNGVSRDHFTIIKQAPPAAPDGLVARVVDANTVQLTWNDHATNEVGYIVERSIDGTHFDRVATNATGSASATDAGLLAQATYFYRVRAYNPGGESPASGVAGVSTVIAATSPAPPSGLVANAGTGAEAFRSQIYLRWIDRSANEAGFLIERSSDASTFSTIGSVPANVTLFLDQDLASATAYYYRIRSFNNAGDSAPSAPDGDQTHPQDAIVLPGESATFHAGIEGTAPIRYQWQFLGTTIPGATNESFTLASAKAGDEGSYSVVITDATGVETSNPAWLFVLPPPTIVANPISRTNLVGSTAVFQVVAGGLGPLFYQWRKEGTNVAGATSDKLSIAPVALGDQAFYDVIVANSLGAVTSLVARLEVNRAPLALPDRLSGLIEQPMTIATSALLANDSDPDGEPLALTSVSLQSSRGGALSLSGPSLTYIPAAGVSGLDTFTYLITDPRGGTAQGLVTVDLSANRAPSLEAIPNLVAQVLLPIRLTNHASDPNVGDVITFTLGPGAPTNAAVKLVSGVFLWTPTREQAHTSNSITITATDSGQPALSSQTTFSIYVNDFIEVTAGSATSLVGLDGSVAIDFFSSAALSQLECRILYPEDRLSNLTVEALSPAQAGVILETPAPNTARVTFTATPDHTLQGTQHLARLHFTVVTNQPSAFVPLRIEPVATVAADTTLAPTMLVNQGRVTILGTNPLVEAVLSNGLRFVNVYARTGVNYTLQYNTNSEINSTTWLNRAVFPMTNTARTINAGNPAAPVIFWRLKR